MSKKIDINKVVKGSAKQRAALLIYHYTVLEAIGTGHNRNLKPILADKEAEIIFDSLKDNREIKIYNDYRELNNSIITTLKTLYYSGLQFERDYYKYLYKREVNKSIEDKNKKARANISGESILIYRYSRCINIYTALKIYAKEKGYTNKYVLDNMDQYLNGIQSIYNYYPIETEDGLELSQSFKEIEPDYEEVQSILLTEFNYKYEKEPA